MFDIGATEILLIAVVAILVIGPKDLPLALRTAGRWVGKMRKVSGHFRAGLDAMVREAELEDMEKKWKAQNEKIMREHPDGGPAEMEPTGAYPPAREAAMKEMAQKDAAAIRAKEQAASAQAAPAAKAEAAKAGSAKAEAAKDRAAPAGLSAEQPAEPSAKSSAEPPAKGPGKAPADPDKPGES